VDYIGYVESPIVMVRPMNGKNYDSFIFNQYFGVIIDGEAAADATTLQAIAAIKLIPDKISVNDKAVILAARAAYDKIATMEQQALVTEYNKLVQAEKRLKALEDDLANDPSIENPSNEGETPVENQGTPLYVMILTAAGVALIAAFFVVALVLRKKDALAASEEQPFTVEVLDSNAEKAQQDSESSSEDA
jgi:hypothetical protein